MKKLVLSVAFIAATTMSFAQIGIGTSTPEASAVLDLTSTTQGLLPPRLTEAQINVIVSPVEGLMVYCSDCAVKGMYVFTGGAWEQITGSSVPYVAISSSGETWMNKNLGALHEATSSTDAAAYGDLYQWGRTTDGHEKRNSTVVAGPVASGSEGANFITSGTTPFDWLSTQDNTRWGVPKTANDPCPTGYRVPTETELTAERLLFPTNNAAGAYNSELKLPVAGSRRYYTGALYEVGVRGFYWTSTINGTTASTLSLSSSNVNMFGYDRSNGLSVRCIKE